MKVLIAEGNGEFEVRLHDSSRDCDDFTLGVFWDEVAALAYAADFCAYTGIATDIPIGNVRVAAMNQPI